MFVFNGSVQRVQYWHATDLLASTVEIDDLVQRTTIASDRAHISTLKEHLRHSSKAEISSEQPLTFGMRNGVKFT